MAAALLAAFAGTLLVYLASPRQRVGAPASRRTRWLGLALLTVALPLFGLAMRPATAVFTYTAWLSFTFTAVPFAGALVGTWLDRRGDRATH